MSKFIQTISFFILPAFLCHGQYEDNSSALLKKSGIRSLMVCTDTACSSCPVDYSEYDSQGRKIYHLEAMMEDRWEWFYFKDRLLFSIYYFEGDDRTITMMDTTFYVYDTSNSVKYLIRKECSDGEKAITKFDTIYPSKPKKSPLKNPTYNKHGQLAGHIVGSMTRSCLYHSTGEHTLKYYYKKNGLIDRIDIFKPTKDLYMTWYFKYTDKGAYRRQ